MNKHLVVTSLLILFISNLWIVDTLSVPGEINYQGRLLNSSGQPVTTAVNITFTMWGSETGGDQLGENWSDTDSVTPDSNGNYSTGIGDDGSNGIPETIFDSDVIWLNINIDGEDLAPRVRLLTVPYAVKAGSAGEADRIRGNLENPGDQITIGQNILLQIGADGQLEFIANGDRFRLAKQRWYHPNNIGDRISFDSNGDAAEPVVEMNDKGNILITYSQIYSSSSDIYYAEFRNDQWYFPSTILDSIDSPSYSGDALTPVCDINESGKAYIVWSHDSQDPTRSVYVTHTKYEENRWMNINYGALNPEIGQPAIDPQVAVGNNENSVIAWSQFNGVNTQVYVRFRIGDDFRVVPDITDNFSISGTDANQPAVAINNNNEMLVVWNQNDSTHNQVFYRHYRLGNLFGTTGLVDNISPDGTNTINPDCAIGDNGDAVIVWRQLSGLNSQIFFSEFRNTTWDHPDDINDFISITGQSTIRPTVDVNSNGDSIIAWVQNDGSNDRIYISEYRNDNWSHPTNFSDAISPSGSDADYPQVAINNSGETVIAWRQNDGTNEQIFISEYRNGSWNHPLSLTDNISPADTDAGNPSLAINNKGNTVIVWAQDSGDDIHIYKSEYKYGF